MMCSLLKAMLNFQREDGLFHDILDRQDTFLDGTSAMMMAGCIYRGVYEGWLNPSYLCRADNVYETMCKKIDNVGIIHEVCGSPDFTHSGTSAEAQASFLIMDAWREKIREEQRG